MSEINPDNKIAVDLRTSSSYYDPYGYLIPSYMRNVNSILLAKQQVAKYSWEVEGEKVFSYELSIFNICITSS